jgi:hypothetical protein
MLDAHLCDKHRDESFGAEAGALVEEGCPRCGLPWPEGLHLHRCSKWGRRFRVVMAASSVQEWGTTRLFNQTDCP